MRPPLCLLRLSALGDVTHVVPLVRTLQRAWPGAAATPPLHWIIDKAGHKLLEGLPGVHFHTYDKKTGLAGMRALRRQLMPHAPFAALLQLQVSLRANVLSAFIPARRRIGYDKSRSKEKGGTGLGLAIVKHIVNNNRGTIVVSSQVGEGTEFKITLPKFKDQ